MEQNLDQSTLITNQKIKPSAVYEAPEHTIKTWGRKGTSNGIMGVWGEFVSVDYDICIADGGCLEACLSESMSGLTLLEIPLQNKNR